MKTQQEIFDTVATHLLKQNDKSLDSYGECRYRAEDGNMCAVGCLIDTKHYTSGFEGYLADDNRVAIATTQWFGSNNSLVISVVLPFCKSLIPSLLQHKREHQF